MAEKNCLTSSNQPSPRESHHPISIVRFRDSHLTIRHHYDVASQIQSDYLPRLKHPILFIALRQQRGGVQRIGIA